MRRGLRATGRALIAFGLLALGAGVLLRPEARAPQADGYYDALAAELRAHAPARPIALVDLDRLDANLAAVRSQLKPPQRLRLVTKSLPSLDLIRYALERSGATGLMAFHAPFLPDLLRATAPEVDVLLGKPVAAAEAAEFYAALGPEQANAASQRIQWLVSDVAMLDDYLALAAARGLVLRINLEIDVGLHRGGARNAEELRVLLARLRAAPERARWSGFMGYDGHVAHAPGFGPLASQETRVREAFADMLARYAEFVAIARSEFAELVPAAPTWNGAGSLTYTLYPPDAVVNDLALGGALLMPSTYDVFTLASHRPALFLAAPVLKRIEPAEVPLLGPLGRLWRWWDPNRAVAFYLNGGGWAADLVYPSGLATNPLLESPANENLLPTLSRLDGSPLQTLRTGDFVLYRPRQGDSLTQFETIYLLRGGLLAGAWRPFPRRL
ncbi:MAG: alanine racemase [Myxococcota bacterium]